LATKLKALPIQPDCFRYFLHCHRLPDRARPVFPGLQLNPGFQSPAPLRY
jgi:hypothetical protein